MYFKITNLYECHHGYQYVDGLNVLDRPFEPTGTCVKGGLYFTDAKHILYYCAYGVNVREIDLPIDDPDFLMVKDPEGQKWRANKIILGKKYPLYNVETLKFLVGIGANIRPAVNSLVSWGFAEHDNEILKFVASISNYGREEIIRATIRSNTSQDGIKSLIQNETFVIDNAKHKIFDVILRNGYTDILKLIIDKGFDIKKEIDFLTKKAIISGNTNSINFMIENGASPTVFIDRLKHLNADTIDLFITNGKDFGSENENVFKESCKKGFFSVVEFLIDKVDVHTSNDYGIRYAARFGHYKIVELLLTHGADQTAEDFYAFRWASKCHHKRVLKLLDSC